MASYWIAVPTGSGTSHLTLKWLGSLSPQEVYRYTSLLDDIARSTSKFPVVSTGLGVLGRKSPNMVDFIQPNPRMMGAFNRLGANQPVPHVTRFDISNAMNTGGLSPMDNVLADTINLYKGENGITSVVYSVKLGKRSPLTWIKDSMGLSKYASIPAAAQEAIVGAILGAAPMVATEDPKDAIWTALGGAAVLAGIGQSSRTLQNTAAKLELLSGIPKKRKGLLGAYAKPIKRYGHDRDVVLNLIKSRNYHLDKLTQSEEALKAFSANQPIWNNTSVSQHIYKIPQLFTKAKK